MKNSKQFIYIKIQKNIRYDNQNNNNQNNLEQDDNPTVLSQELARLIWEKVLIPIPAVGFTKLIILECMILKNETVSFSHEFFDLYTA